MKVHFIWRNCEYANGKWGADPVDHFVIECTPDQSDTLVVPWLTQAKEEFPQIREKFRGPQSELEYFQISRDLSSVVPMMWYYPVSPHWNGSSPFVQIESIEIKSLTDLAKLDIPKADWEIAKENLELEELMRLQALALEMGIAEENEGEQTEDPDEFC